MADFLSLSDEALVELCKNDNEKAWNTLSARYLSIAQKIASGLKSALLEEQDLVSEGMLGFLSAVYSFSPAGGATFFTYCRSCMLNRMRNAVRALQTKKQIPPSMLISIEDDTEPGMATASPEELLLLQHEAQRLMELIETVLSEKERAVLMSFIRGNSYQNIALQTGLSRKAVDTALQRARKKLREQFS